MDEKTEELRDIFIDATGADAVTESQEETPGSLTDRDEEAVAERVTELVAAMRDRYRFSAGIDDEAYERVVYGYFDGESDAAIAEGADLDPETVFEARLDLHLVDEDDRDAPFEYAELKRLLAEKHAVEECADRLDADADRVAHYAEIVKAEMESTRANDRFRDEFRNLLTDAEIEGGYAREAREDGLKDATEDIETDVSL